MSTAPAPHSDLRFLRGIGEKRAEALATRGIATPAQLLRYYPFRYVDATSITTIKELRRRVRLEPSTESITVVGKITSVRAFAGRGTRVVHTLDDGTSTVQLVWFGATKYFERAFAIGETIAVFGTPGEYNGTVQFVHPDFDRLDDEAPTLNTGIIVPHYHSGEPLKAVGLDSRGIRRIMRTCVEQFAAIESDPLPLAVRTRQQLVDLAHALHAIHFPETLAALESARHRLKFEEFFLFQIVLANRRRGVAAERGIAFTVKSALARAFVDTLPFKLTTAQTRVLREISADMALPVPMNRMLQGDVGSGKTVVALLAMLVAVDNGYQCALMAPTEVLCEQHFRNLTAYLKPLKINVAQLIGGQNKRLRREILEQIASGEAQIVVGTHALIQEHVAFKNLGFIVIDEQHRFGVMQRAALRQKSHQPDVLVMTATPIPRTLSLTLYGDLDISVIDQLPAGRKEIITRLGYETDVEKVWSFVRKEVKAGRQVYVVFPLVEKSEKLDYKAAVEQYEHLKTEIFPDLRIGLMHGKMFGYEKDEVMTAFSAGEIDVLVTTTVIEVGVDVANATAMVVMHAERFGLAQLHQLRGRVGRGAHQSYCLLVASDRVRSWMHETDEEQRAENRTALTRLQTMVETTDGFKIAEVDLELRGPGDFLGTRQSGMPEFVIANIVRDAEILARARAEAFALMEDDPDLQRPEHAALRERLQGAMAQAETVQRA